MTACTTTGRQNAPIERKENTYYKYQGPVTIQSFNENQTHSSENNGGEANDYQKESVAASNQNQLSDRSTNNYDDIPPAQPTEQGPISEPHTLERQLEEKEMQDSRAQGGQIYYDQQDLNQNNKSELLETEQAKHDHQSNIQNLNQNDSVQETENLQYKSYAIASPLGLNEFAWPINGKVIRHMSEQPEEFKEGISIAAPEGTTVRCASDGEVIYAGNNQDKFGNLVIVKHPKGYLTAYAHNSEMIVKKGDKIKRGQPIAKVGITGDLGKGANAQKPQLYFSIRKDRIVVDPEKRLSK